MTRHVAFIKLTTLPVTRGHFVQVILSGRLSVKLLI
nr:MAG TPA: hypothetical protein [Caudoviricetes sp.]